MKHDYKVFLFSIYKENRERPKWDLLASIHDDQDRGYFESLDKKYRKQIEVKEPTT